MFKTIATTLVACAAAATLSAQTPAPTSMSKPAPKQTMMAKPMARKDTPASLRKEAKISMTTARRSALKEVPNGKVRTSEIERENGKLIYSFGIKVAGKSGIEEVNIDAMTGALVAHEHETPKTEKKEAAAEKKEKK
ncbi:MAG: PepSY domain-containing protein [Gemmatimonadales bacterium]